MNIEILYKSYQLLVLNKPVGVPVECPIEHGTPLWMTVQERFGNYLNCHRIDKNTSGIILFAKEPIRSTIMRRWHFDTSKSYLAITLNPRWTDMSCDQPVETENGLKTAVTGFHILQRWQGLALVQCDLTQNGRRHQIRQHLKFLGYPILGDLVYGGEPTRARRGQLLHAWKLSLVLEKDSYHFQAPVPLDFKKAFKGDWSLIDQRKSLPAQL